MHYSNSVGYGFNFHFVMLEFAILTVSGFTN